MSGSEDTPTPDESVDPDVDDADDAFQAGLEDLPDGSGCAEIWDYLSDQRRRD